MNWTNRRVLVTGAETNTGYEIARQFALVGATVFIHAPTMRKAREATTRLRPEARGGVFPVAADFRRPGEIARMLDAIGKHGGQINILVNNAVHQAVGFSMRQLPRTMLRDAIAVNLEGLFICTQLVVEGMAEQGGGVIINIGSNTSERAIRNRAIYIATKGAVDALTRALAVELAGLKIRVNTVVPGYIYSDRWKSLSRRIAARRRANLPLGHEVKAVEVADAVLFLASEAARSITGARLAVDGGSLAQLLPEDVEV